MHAPQADDLFLCKFSSISSQTAFKSQLQAFESSQHQTVFVLVSMEISKVNFIVSFLQVINMQETSRQIVNHIRIMIEEVEYAKRKANVSYNHPGIHWPD